MGSILNIKPVLTSSSGLVRFKGVVKNRERGKSRLLQTLRDKVGQSPVHVAVMHAYAPEEAEVLKERISNEFNCAELWVTEFSPVMGYATGTGTLGFAFYKDWVVSILRRMLVVNSQQTHFVRIFNEGIISSDC
jgi:fatty acid-binding protein DegV